MPRMEVRCCCQPKKLPGWLDVPVGAQEYKFILVDVDRVAIRDQRPRSPDPFLHPPLCRQPEYFDRYFTHKTIVLPVAEISLYPGVYHRALKSEETPIETLRMIPGFVEAADAEHSH